MVFAEVFPSGNATLFGCLGKVEVSEGNGDILIALLREPVKRKLQIRPVVRFAAVFKKGFFWQMGRTVFFTNRRKMRFCGKDCLIAGLVID